MSVERIDVQWIVVCDGSAQSTLVRVKSNVDDGSWTLVMEVKDMDGNAICVPDKWPSETMGSGAYTTAGGVGKRTLFWSTYSDRFRTKITGGLYLHEFDVHAMDAVDACERALGDLRHLFRGDEVSCIVLALEDDEEIDVAPGILGAYREDVWRGVSDTARRGVVEQHDGDWVLVRPAVEGYAPMPISVYSMPEPIQESLQGIQTELNRQFWLDDEDTKRWR